MTLEASPVSPASAQLCLLDEVESRALCVDDERPPTVVINGRRLQPTRVFDTYWRFAAARHAVYQARLNGKPAPWTKDPIISRHRFTNCYRAADRVSQYLIRVVSYTGPQDAEEVFFRTLLFKIFNRISSWELLRTEFDEISWSSYSFERYNEVLSNAFTRGYRLYSAAYVIPPPSFGEARKHSNHLRLLEHMMKTRAADRVVEARSMRSAFEVLRSYPAVGDFLAYQYLIDLNYSSALNYNEMEFVVAGPGARDGIRKCFGPAADGIEADVIRYMADHQDEQFRRLGLAFGGLRGRPLQLIDCQNLFCEVDKYARVAHPNVPGRSGRSRIKQVFRPLPEAIPAWFPPKWGINDAAPDNESRPTMQSRWDGRGAQASLFATETAQPTRKFTSVGEIGPITARG